MSNIETERENLLACMKTYMKNNIDVEFEKILDVINSQNKFPQIEIITTTDGTGKTKDKRLCL